MYLKVLVTFNDGSFEEINFEPNSYATIENCIEEIGGGREAEEIVFQVCNGFEDVYFNYRKW